MTTERKTPIRQAEDLPDLIPVPYWAEYTNISLPTLARHRGEGTGAPFIRIGRSVRYPKQAALAWLESLADAS